MKPGVTTSAVAWFEHALAARALRPLLAATDRAGIDVLPVKGVILARTLYGDPGERPMSDVDLRVRPADLEKTAHVCRREGWEPLRLGRQWGSFEILVGRTLVEFESSVGPPGLCELPIHEMIARATRTEAHLGFSHLEPELNDHAILLCVNVFKDKFHYVAPWTAEDFRRIACHANFDPARVVSLAKRADVRAIVWIVADWAARRAGAEGWTEVRERLGRKPPRALYVSAFMALSRSQRRGARAALRILARAGSDRVASRGRALALSVAGDVAAFLHRARPRAWTSRA